MNRLHKVLEDAGVKLAVVASDVLGVSGRAMLEALLRGTTDPKVLAELSRGKLRKKIPELRRALEGRFATHHRFLVGADPCSPGLSRRGDRRMWPADRGATAPFRGGC